MKKITLFLIILLFLTKTTFADEILDSCEYKKDVEDCLTAVKNGTYLTITDYLCINSTNQYNILYQIILDKEFKKLDVIAEENINKLEQERDTYFGQNAKKDVLDAVDNIETTYGPFSDLSIKYRNLCNSNGGKNSIIGKLNSCIKTSIPDIETKGFVSYGDCQSLANTKLTIYKDISYSILKINKSQIKADQDKQLMQDQRKKYDKLSDLFLLNLDYLEKIWKRWPSKTKNAN